MEVRFAYPWMLFMLWLAPIMLTGAVLLLKRKEARLAEFVAPAMQKRLRPASDFKRQIWQLSLAAAGILLCMIAAARPQWGRSEQTVFRKGRDVVICLDVSRSMLANDVHPNRLQRAKIDIMDLLNEISGDRTALLAFRHKAVTLCPLTTDYAFLRHILDMSGIHSAPRGETDIGNAIDHAVEILSEDDSTHRAVLLITDGEDLTGKAVSAAEKAAERGIPIFTVGFGRASGSTIPDEESGGSLKYKGSDVVSKLDNDTLYKIAKTTGGAYIPIQTASTAETTLGNIYKDHFSKIAAKEMEETLSFSYSERFHYFLLPGILLLLAACFLSKGRLSGKSNLTSQPATLKNISGGDTGLKQIALAVIFITPALCLGETNTPSAAPAGNPVKASAPDGRAAARKAQRLHNSGDFSGAAELYLHAARTMSGPARESFIYNSAASLFNEGKFSEAIDLLQTISGEGAIPLDKLSMALGSAHYRASDAPTGTNRVTILDQTASNIEKAAEYFAEAARLNPAQRELALNNAGLLLQKLPDAKQTAKEAALLAENEKIQPFDLLDRILKNQRDITRQAAEAYTTDDPSQIKLLEALAKQQEQNADLWIPMKEKLAAAAGASTNQMTAGQLDQLAANMASTMLEAAAGMKDLETGGYHQSALAGESTYRLWKQIAPFSKVLEEDLMRQSNAMDKAASRSLRAGDQAESADLTSIFKDRFSSAFPEDAPAPAEAAEDQMTPEKRKRILELADQVLEAQKQAAKAIESDTPADLLQEKALAALNEISTLLPKDQNNQDKQQQQDQPQQQDQQEQKPQENENQPENQQPDQKPQQTGEPEKQDEPEKQEQKTEKPEEGELSEDEVERLLEKALQREKEREEDLRRRNEFTPSKMIDRDW